MNINNLITEIPVAQSFAREDKCPKCWVECSKGKPIVTTKSSKLQESEERDNKNCDNQVVENGRKKKKRERETQRERELWQSSC